MIFYWRNRKRRGTSGYSRRLKQPGRSVCEPPCRPECLGQGMAKLMQPVCHGCRYSADCFDILHMYRALLPFSVIAAAADGDTKAMCAVLKHYEGYIAALCTRWKTSYYGGIWRKREKFVALCRLSAYFILSNWQTPLQKELKCTEKKAIICNNDKNN